MGPESRTNVLKSVSECMRVGELMRLDLLEETADEPVVSIEARACHSRRRSYVK